jgi:hypothetical protein
MLLLDCLSLQMEDMSQRDQAAVRTDVQACGDAVIEAVQAAQERERL